ncbi:hypothetical protein G7Z17_g2495 [Cylindrodendrum hubeiense]|uniref:C2H2-type domain-containing protein n=1 Tax=Cylindrodendrum hubeiense TaxID=595255 RepID=A0A9P5LBL1_9HYPO|nr:hypothetical protein G7Z17_g2495 [Cylindrodendrum hubeiense]
MNSLSEQRPISSLAHQCDVALTKLYESLPASLYRNLENAAADEAGRFKIWAANIGAMEDPQTESSLDSRLNMADRMRNSLMSGLCRLDDVASRADAIVSGIMPNRTKSPMASTEHLVQCSVQRVSQGFAEENDTNSSSSPTTELAELFLNIRSAITHLFALSMLVRRDRPQGRSPPHGPQHVRTDPGPDIASVKDTFPKLKHAPWLAERIGSMVNQQRNYIRYRQAHRKNLMLQSIATGQADFSERATTKATSFHDTLDKLVGLGDDSTRDLTDRSIVTAVTSFAAAAVGDTHSGRTIPPLMSMWLDGVQLDYDDDIECPYCRTIQKVKDEQQWKRHVYQDLQPYVCTFKDCPVDPFPTSHEWFEHEMDNHRRQWQCNQCHAKCDSPSALDDHFISHHSGTISAAQRPVLLKVCEKALTTFDKTVCPLCDDWNPLLTDKNNSDRFRSHLGNHLQELAREALPLAIDGLEIRNPESNIDCVTDEEDEDISLAIAGLEIGNSGSNVDSVSDKEDGATLEDDLKVDAKTEARAVSKRKAAEESAAMAKLGEEKKMNPPDNTLDVGNIANVEPVIKQYRRGHVEDTSFYGDQLPIAFRTPHTAGFFDMSNSPLKNQFQRPISAMGYRQTPTQAQSQAPDAYDYDPEGYEEEPDPRVTRRASRFKRPPVELTPQPQPAEPADSPDRPPPVQKSPTQEKSRPLTSHQGVSIADQRGYDEGDLLANEDYTNVSPEANDYGRRSVLSRTRRGYVPYKEQGFEIMPASQSQRGVLYGGDRGGGVDLDREKSLAALEYQDDFNSGTPLALTAEALRKASHRAGGGSSRSTRSSDSRDESEFMRSNTTGITRLSDISDSDNDNDNVTIKVSGSAVVRVQGAEIECADGGEITFSTARGSRISSGSNRASTIHKIEDSRS